MTNRLKVIVTYLLSLLHVVHVAAYKEELYAVFFRVAHLHNISTFQKMLVLLLKASCHMG